MAAPGLPVVDRQAEGHKNLTPDPLTGLSPLLKRRGDKKFPLAKGEKGGFNSPAPPRRISAGIKRKEITGFPPAAGR